MKSAATRFEETILTVFQHKVAKWQSVNAENLSNGELSERIAECRRWVMDDFGPESLLPGMLGAIAVQRFESQLVQILGPADGRTLAAQLTPAGDASLCERQQTLLHKLARDDDMMATFVDEFGHRAIGEMELRTPRWRETLDLLRQLAVFSAEDTPEATTPFVDRHAVAGDRLREAFTSTGASSLLGPAETSLAQSWRLLPYRDRGKHHFLRGYEQLRRLIEAAGRRLDVHDDAYFLTLDELIDTLRGAAINAPITRRRQEGESNQQMTLPAVIDPQGPDAINDKLAAEGQSRADVFGTPLVEGQANGTRLWNVGLDGTDLDERSAHPCLPGARAVAVAADAPFGGGRRRTGRGVIAWIDPRPAIPSPRRQTPRSNAATAIW